VGSCQHCTLLPEDNIDGVLQRVSCCAGSKLSGCNVRVRLVSSPGIQPHTGATCSSSAVGSRSMSSRDLLLSLECRSKISSTGLPVIAV
jgi:hypothetical protein